MQRIIDKYKPQFLREDGTQKCATGIHVPFSEIPYDLDLSSLDTPVQPFNMLYDDCTIQILNFDGNSNRLILEIPAWVQYSLFRAYHTGLETSARLITKLAYEEDLIKHKQPIPYANTVA